MSARTEAAKREGREWLVVGGMVGLVGLAIILWPERGLMPHPLPFPPSSSTRPIAGFAVLGYPLLGVGLLFALAGAVRVWWASPDSPVSTVVTPPRQETTARPDLADELPDLDELVALMIRRGHGRGGSGGCGVSVEYLRAELAAEKEQQQRNDRAPGAGA